MNPPKIISVQPLDDYLLMIKFSNHEYRRYNVKPLLKKERINGVRNKRGQSKFPFNFP
jgi:hypothetical protein